MKLSVLVLDYCKPRETRLCLESLRANLHVPCKIIYQDNGGGPTQDYVWQLYKNGLCDVLISKVNGEGGGVGQTDLFRFADTPYSLFVQSDQIMQLGLDERVLDQFTLMLDNGISCIDLNGDQSNRGHLD